LFAKNKKTPPKIIMLHQFYTSLIIGLLLLSSTAFAQTSAAQNNAEEKLALEQDQDAMHYAQGIEVETLKQHLDLLAGPEYAGRGNGQEGQKKAGRYLADYFRQLKLPAIVGDSSYLQTVPLVTTEQIEATITVNGKIYEFMQDLYCFSRGSGFTEYLNNKALFLGYGIDDPKYSDYAGKDANGQVLLILAGEPTRKDGTSWLTGSKEPSVWTTDWRKKIDLARNKGAKALLVLTPQLAKKAQEMKSYINNPEIMQLEADAIGRNPKEKMMNVFYVSDAIADRLLRKKTAEYCQQRINQSGKPYMRRIKTPYSLEIQKKINPLSVENVLGYIEGSDAVLKNEVVIITAHYDHLGIEHGNTYYGADDDGSGTVALLEIAQAFTQAKADGKGPKRSILIMPVAGEEKGLLGSRYYTDIQPILPLKNTIANLNIDMIGRVDDEHTDGNYIYVIGSDKLSKELHNINETANQRYTRLNLDYRFNAENDPNRFYYRSDHYNFAKNRIPVIFYFNGVHADYHQPSDTVEKIDYEALKKRTQLVFYTAWDLANRPQRIKVD